MIITKEGTICVLLCFSLISICFLWTAGHSLFSLRKSKTKMKKIVKDIPFYKKMLLRYPNDSLDVYTKKFRIIQIIYWIYLLIVAICLLILLLSVFYPRIEKLFMWCTYLKVLLADIPICFYSFIMTKHGKSGGTVWRWE